jgi:hypothetical protein
MKFKKQWKKKKLWAFNDKFHYEKDCLQTQQAIETINTTNDDGGNVKQKKPKLNIRMIFIKNQIQIWNKA